MVGLEIAGVVLGSLPLVISALEHYAEGINTAKKYWRHKSEVRSLILQITTERGIFINTLELLLTGIVRIERMTDYISEPRRDKWQAIEEPLKDRLRNVYDIYFDNVRSMEISLKQMMEKLALTPEGKPQFTDVSLFKQEYKRLKFSLQRSEYSESLNNLRLHNQALIRLTQQSLDLEPYRSKTRKHSYPNFKAIQSYAQNLYNTLVSGLQCTGSGCNGHGVNLRIENRTAKEEAESMMLERTAFRVIFTSASGQSRNKDHCISTSWKETEIRCLVESPTDAHPKVSLHQTPPVPSRRVRFTLIAPPAIPASANPPQQIRDLCTAIKSLQGSQSGPCVGYLLDHMNRKHGIYSLDPPHTCDQKQWTSYSFRHLFTKRSNTIPDLTLVDKLRVAISLSSSILQLYSTPWLDTDWDSSEVFFVHRSGIPADSMYEHLFVHRSLESRTGMTTAVPQQERSRIIPNQTLYTLGILLIEICYGKSIKELQIAEDLECQDTPGVTWCTATRLANKQIEFRVGKPYADAVEWCIRCDSHRENADLGNEIFQQAVFDRVVMPIEQNLKFIQGIF